MKAAFPLIAVLMLGLAGCSSDPEPAAAPKAAAPAPAHVADHTSLFLGPGIVGTKVVPDHLFDIKKLPGGSLAEYEVKGQKYQEFIIETTDNQTAAFMMMDIKDAMKDKPEYLAHIGGYFGMYGDRPLYAYAKKQYVAGVVGLPKDKADPLAIQLAGQLH